MSSNLRFAPLDILRGVRTKDTPGFDAEAYRSRRGRSSCEASLVACMLFSSQSGRSGLIGGGRLSFSAGFGLEPSVVAIPERFAAPTMARIAA